MLAGTVLNNFAGALAIAWIGLLSPPAISQTRLDIDGIDINSDETELEFQTRLADAGTGPGLDFQLQADHAIDDRWALGAELEFEREPGAALLVDTAVGRVKWRSPRSLDGIAFALQAGAGYAFQDDAAVIETAAYVGWSSDAWSLAGKLSMEQLLRARAEPDFGYRVQLAHELESGIGLGVEVAGDLWTGDDRTHRFGPFFELPLGGDDAPVLELGAFARLTGDSPDMQYRVEIEFEF